MCLEVFSFPKGDAQGARKATVPEASPVLDWEGQFWEQDGHVEGPLSVRLVVVTDDKETTGV